MYVGSKTAVRALTEMLRKELVGRIRVTTVDPGMVGDTEFSDVRFQGDSRRRRRSTAGVRYLTPDDVADCILWAVTRPAHVNVDEIVVKPLQQASQDADRPGPVGRCRCTILEGATFCVSDELGDIVEPTMGFFAARHALPLALGADDQRRAAAAALLAQGRVLLGRLLPAEPGRRRPRARRDLDRPRALRRRRACRSTSSSRTTPPPAGRVRARARARERLRGHLRRQGVTTSRSATPSTRAAPAAGRARLRAPSDNQFVFSRATTASTGTRRCVLSERGEVDGGTVRYRIALEPRERWQLRVDVIPRRRRRCATAVAARRAPLRRRARARPRVARGLAAARPAAPRLLGRPRRTPSASRSPTSPRSAWTRTARARASSRPPGCRGS